MVHGICAAKKLYNFNSGVMQPLWCKVYLPLNIHEQMILPTRNNYVHNGVWHLGAGETSLIKSAGKRQKGNREAKAFTRTYFMECERVAASDKWRNICWMLQLPFPLTPGGYRRH